MKRQVETTLTQNIFRILLAIFMVYAGFSHLTFNRIDFQAQVPDWVSLGKNFINILSNEKADEYAHGQITEGFLKAHISDFTKNVYLCGPPPMMEAIEKQLANLKIDEKQIIKEVF